MANVSTISVGEILAPDAALWAAGRGLEPRPQQAAMAGAVEKALERGGHLIVEAGTGVGKSLAYLLPCALWAARNGKRVVISTFTKALQAQLLEKDLPLARAVLDKSGLDFRYALLMGTDNYLCADRLRRAAAGGRELFDGGPPAGMLEKLLDWSEEGDTALRSKLPCAVPPAVWEKISRDADLCLATKDQNCLYRRDLARAREAHLLVVNHHLFFAGLPLGDVDAVVFDEAHTLEDAAAGFLGFELSDRALKRLADDVYNPATGRGLIRRLLHSGMGLRNKAEKTLAAFHDESASFFEGIADTLKLNDKETSRRLKSPLPVEDRLAAPLAALESLLDDALGVASSSEEEAEINSLRDRAKQARARLGAFFQAPPADRAQWAERSGGRRGAAVSLRAAPVDVSAVLRARLFKAHPTVVLTSATLAVAGSFKTARERVGMDAGEELLLDSPFDYKSQAVLYLPDVPDPKEDPRAHERAVSAQCQELARLVPGGIFVLFTSWALLERTHGALKGTVEDRPLFKQGEEAPYALVEKFKAAGNGLLLGTDTFWQGVDVPGKALRCVVITRLPFAVPTDPLEEARQEWLASRGKDVFKEYVIPRAVIKFRQGFGRLIRAREDSGAVAVLDPRAETKPYGRVFLDSLPPCRRVKTPSELAGFFQPSR